MKTQTAEQTQAINFCGNDLLLVAGPGSGKTTVLIKSTRRILNGSPDARVVSVTFTKSAAQEFAARIAKESNPRIVERLKSGTFHSLSIFLLRRAGRLNLLLTPGQQAALFANAICSSKWPKSHRAAVAVLSRHDASWNSVTFDAYELCLIEHYLLLLETTKAVDFSTLIRACIDGFKSGKVEPFLVDRMFIDEAQDLDQVQLEWVKCHSQAGVKITLVGDDDQSVYSFRHGLGQKGLTAFKNELRATVLFLQSNFRSAPEILDHSNRLIANGSNRFSKIIVATQPPGGDVLALEYASPAHELAGLSMATARDHMNWAVLARWKADLDKIELALVARGLPVHRASGESIYDEKSVTAFISTLIALLDTTSIDPLVLSLSCVGLITASSPSLSLITNTDSLFELLASSDCLKSAPNALASLKLLSLRWSAWQSLVRSSALVDNLLGDIEKWVGAWFNDRDRKILNVFVSSFKKRSGPLRQRLRNYQSERTGEGCIHLMTLHKSKGLEFDSVWLFGLQDLSKDKNYNLEEERRLVYVGMTRAKRVLRMSCNSSKPVSPFFSEAGLRLNEKSSDVRSMGSSDCVNGGSGPSPMFPPATHKAQLAEKKRSTEIKKKKRRKSSRR